jgi:hypothetical protein
LVGVGDLYFALLTTRPYKEGYSHEKTITVLAKDDRSGISGADWYGDDIWGVFKKHHLCFKEIFESMQN